MVGLLRRLLVAACLCLLTGFLSGSPVDAAGRTTDAVLISPSGRPLDGAQLNGPTVVRFAGKATSVIFRLDRGNETRKENAPFAVTIRADRLSAGPHRLYSTRLDRNGRTQQSTASFTVRRSTTPAPGTKDSGSSLQVGVAIGSNPQAVHHAARLGAKVVRLEYVAGTPASEVRDVMEASATTGVRVQPLIGWENGTPTPDLTFLADWARIYGPGGSFWSGKERVIPITEIELGNENSAFYKSGLPDDPKYLSLARTYGTRAVEVARAIHKVNPKVGVLVELEASDSKKPAWIDSVLDAGGPDLAKLMHGPVMHTYGPDSQEAIDRNQSLLVARGIHRPFWITEWGLASDDGALLTDNFGYPKNMTYSQAATVLQRFVAAQARSPEAVHQIMLYQANDQRASGESKEREHYFGLTKVDGSVKGAYTSSARALFKQHP